MSDQVKPVRVLIVDDHDMVRIGLKVSIEASDELEFVGEASSGVYAVKLYRELRPDVVLMDLIMPHTDGVAATQQIRAFDPDARIIALTSFDEDDLIHKALEAGVTGYLLKDVSIDKLSQAIQDAHRGKSTLAPEATRTLISAAKPTKTPGHDLTPSELIVLKHIVHGMSNNEIAEELVISTSTVKKHVSSILGKMGVSNRAEAAALAVQHKLVTM